jgi:butyryl-CoA dehydrogenase
MKRIMEKQKYQPERVYLTQAINDEILQKLSLRHRYNFLNANLQIMLRPEEMEFLKEVQEFCLEYEKKVDHTEDIYKWYPDFGKKGYICRVHSLEEIDMPQSPYGLTADLMRHLGLEFFDPPLSWSIDASVLALIPILKHHNNVDVRLKALKELVIGKAIGCLCITEPERGSDATHQLTICQRKGDGLILNGTKIFSTNGPKSKWAIVYATTEANNPDNMTQSLVQIPSDGLTVERVFIPAAPRVFLGKETFKDVFVPNDQILGDVGKGKMHMFEGLVPERVSIAIRNIGESWSAITHAAIYSNLRQQMGKEILRHQGVGFTLVDLWARTTNLTRAMLNFCRSYDEIVEEYSDGIPETINRALVTSASMLKYNCARNNVETVNECANLMGGAGVCDNTMMWDNLSISRLQEIVGGTRQIQQYIMSHALHSIYKISCGD